MNCKNIIRCLNCNISCRLARLSKFLNKIGYINNFNEFAQDNIDLEQELLRKRVLVRAYSENSR